MVKLKHVANECEIHTFISDNLDVILGVRFLASEYAFPDGRIDTLGIDDNNFPVIIEYKKRKSSEVILKALFFKNWVVDHKRARVTNISCLVMLAN
jgi:RecB family endonuclease NucS